MPARSFIAISGLYLASLLPSSAADPVNIPSFSDYALAPALSADEALTVELLIDSVRASHDESYWDDAMERDEAREAKDYKPSFTKEQVALAAAKLPGEDWLSIQMVSKRIPVRNLSPLRYMTRLEGLAAGSNEIANLAPLKGLTELRRLHLEDNKVVDLSPLAACTKLRELHLDDNPVADFSPIAGLRELSQLSITSDQMPALRKAGKLPFLKQLTVSFIWDVDLETIPLESLEALPEMPELQVLGGIKTRSLAGVQRFTKLRNLSVDLGDHEPSLELLGSLGTLTHLHLTGDKIADIGPLSKLAGLRSLWLLTGAPSVKLKPLEKLSMLHEANVRCGGKEPAEAKKLQAKLSPWEGEFQAKEARHKPELTLVTVDEKGFDAIDDKAPQGTRDPDSNVGLLGSELEWLDAKIKPVFGRKLEEDEDYSIPFNWQERRWRDVILHTPKADKDLARIVGGIQKVLCETKNDWIIHLESETEYKLWIYPDKLVVPQEHEATVKRLLGK